MTDYQQIITALRDRLIQVTAERDALRARLNDQPGYSVVKHPTRPLFLQAAVINDGHWPGDDE